MARAMESTSMKGMDNSKNTLRWQTLLDLLVARIARFSAALPANAISFAVLSQLLASVRKVVGQGTVPTQPYVGLAVWYVLGFSQQALLLSYAKATSSALFEAQSGDLFVGIRVPPTPLAPLNVTDKNEGALLSIILTHKKTSCPFIHESLKDEYRIPINLNPKYTRNALLSTSLQNQNIQVTHFGQNTLFSIQKYYGCLY